MGYLFLTGVVVLLVGFGIVGNTRKSQVGIEVFLCGLAMMLVVVAGVVGGWLS